MRRSSDEDLQARVGEWSRRLTTPAALETFAATLSYRLEPEGRGTRFPLLDQLLPGRLEAVQAPAALSELEMAVRELKGVLPSEVVGTLDVLREAILECQRSGYPLTVDPGPVRGGVRRGVTLVAVGILVSLAGWFVVPNQGMQTGHPGAGRHGVPFWGLGLVLLATGGWEIAMSRSPALADVVRRRPVVPLVIGLGLLALFAYLTWR